MRLKHKSTGVELEVFLPRVYLEVYGGQPFYKTKDGSFIAHGDYDWELVKEEEWEDVTHLLEVQDKSIDYSVGYMEGTNVVDTIRGYRLRKHRTKTDQSFLTLERKKA